MPVHRTRRELSLCIAFHGGNLHAEKKERMVEWLATRGITLDKVPRLNEALRLMKDGKTGGQLTSTVTSDDVERLIEVALGEQAGGAVDMEAVRKLVAAEVLSATPHKIVIDGNEKPVKIDKHTHPLFEKVLRLVRSGLNVMLVGPAGCGKTTLAEQIAEALKRDYGMLHCTSGASESQLTGWLLPINPKSTAFEYVSSEFIRLYEKGNSVFLIDEMDAADPNMLLILNSATANGHMHVPQRHKNPHVKRGLNVAIIAACNTYGSGADIMYAGRNQLDAATLDRYYVVEMQYDTTLEAQITGNTAPTVAKWVPAESPSTGELQQLGAWLNALRVQISTHKLRRVVSTRAFQKAMAARRAGVPSNEIKRDLLAGWTRDELHKVGVTQ